MTIAMISGGFDPLHVGHLELIKFAAVYGDVIVALNSDKWLENKKGYVFMCYYERSRILSEIRLVSFVVPAKDEDGTVCKSLRDIHPNFFVNGGDRDTPNPDEDGVCRELGIIQIFGGAKLQSSSQLVKQVGMVR